MQLLVIVSVALALFWPRYDLDIAQDINWKNHYVAEEGFLTLSSCREASARYRAADWICLKKTGWGQMFNKYSKYDSKHR
jgi:hypothetical protein